MRKPAPLPRFALWLPLLLSLACGGLVSHPAAAQEDPDPKWYQVELIIFAQDENRDSKEVWRTDIDLDYPLDWKELLSPAQLSAAAEAPGDAAASPGGASETIDPSKTVGDRAFLLLPEEEWTLADDARRLSRNGDYRILFHGAWRQPMVENRKEPAILIAGGEAFGEHHELEGSVRLYLRTYLHIETDLWLSRFATNFGQEHPPWPSLPWPPNRPAEAGDLFVIDDGGSGLWHQFTQTGNAEYEAVLSDRYVVEQVVLMQQQRRMRSDELHYIDHPKMGLLVKLTPYEPPEEETASETAPLGRAPLDR